MLCLHLDAVASIFSQRFFISFYFSFESFGKVLKSAETFCSYCYLFIFYFILQIINVQNFNEG